MEKIFSSPQNLVLILAFAVPIVAIIGYYVHEVIKHRADNDLKRSMLNRGMSAEEIERVLNAGGKRSAKR